MRAPTARTGNWIVHRIVDTVQSWKAGEVMIGILGVALFVVWFLISQFIAGWICGNEEDEEIVLTVYAGSFLLPVILSTMFLAWLTWRMLKFANYMGYPFFEQATDNPMDYLL